jgi:glycosyltransferase involved in cell wall biosynthesis
VSALRVIFFGTYDARSHPRVAVLRDGLKVLGVEVVEVNVPLGLDTASRVRILRRPWLLPVFAAHLFAAWARLWRLARRTGTPDAVVVGYMGHLDVLLARRLWRRRPIVLDHLVFASDTAADRRVEAGVRTRALARLDQAALAAADVIVVDTDEHFALLSEADRERAVVVPVGAPEEWFHEPEARQGSPLRVVFFGLYTPLQGAPVIGKAISLLAGTPVEFTMIGKGQDRDLAEREARHNPSVKWLDWLDPQALPALVAEHDVCLGIFGTTPKAFRVVPNKVFQGAAAGAAVVTSDTRPQRAALDSAAAFVPPGDPGALAGALRELAADGEALARLRSAAHERATAAFRPASIAAGLRDRIAGLAL